MKVSAVSSSGACGRYRRRTSTLVLEDAAFRYQKSIRNPSCTWRGSFACVVNTPKVCGLCKLTAGSRKFTWLNRLKNSDRSEERRVGKEGRSRGERDKQ